MSSQVPITERALAILRAHGEPMAAGDLGSRLWPDRDGPVMANHGGGDYAAQMLLGRMRKNNLVRVVDGPATSYWEPV